MRVTDGQPLVRRTVTKLFDVPLGCLLQATEGFTAQPIDGGFEIWRCALGRNQVAVVGTSSRTDIYDFLVTASGIR